MFRLKVILSLVAICGSYKSFATSTLERNLVECTISDRNYYAEIILKDITLEDGDLNTYQSYALDYVNGALYGQEVDLLGAHEQVRDRIFTTANADSDDILAPNRRDYVLISRFDRSEVEIYLEYAGRDHNGFDSYEISLDGYGPVFQMVYDKYQEILDGSEIYQAYDRPLCTTHFNLDDFVQ